MKKFEGILICTDLDGTLLKKDKTISKENAEAIEYFKENGGKFTFITGRMPYYISDMYNKVRPNAPIGCINGGGVFDYPSQKYLWKQELDPSSLEIARYVYDNVDDIGIQLSGFEKAYFCSENSAMAEFRKITGIPKLEADINSFDLPFAKILFGNLDPDQIDRVTRLITEHPMIDSFTFTRSELTLCEILPKGISKATALMKIADGLGIDLKKTVAVGDYNNDVGMISAAGVGIAVANAVQEAKDAADLVTVSNEESAIAAIIYGIEQGTIVF